MNNSVLIDFDELRHTLSVLRAHHKARWDKDPKYIGPCLEDDTRAAIAYLDKAYKDECQE